jgi:hypothetical protein
MHGRSIRSLQDISKDIDLHAIAQKYELPCDAVKETVERSISDTLSGILCCDVECVLTEAGSEIYLFREDKVERLQAERLKKNIVRAIEYNIVLALRREHTSRTHEILRCMAGSVAGGYITKIFDNRMYVELDAGGDSPVVGVCEKQHQTPKERGLYRIGDYYNFYISTVRPIINGNVPSVKVSLSRTSRRLTEGLFNRGLAEKLLNVTVRCLRRAAGVHSLIEAEERIPKECIKAVSYELKERIIVSVIQKK